MLRYFKFYKKYFSLNAWYPEPDFSPKLNLKKTIMSPKEIVEKNYKRKLKKNDKWENKFKGYFHGKIFKDLTNRLKLENSYDKEGFIKGFGFDDFIKNFAELRNKNNSVEKNMEEIFGIIYNKLNIMKKNELLLIAKGTFIRNLKESTTFKEKIKNLILKNLVDLIYEKKYKEVINYSNTDINFKDFENMNKNEIKKELINKNVELKNNKINSLSNKLARFKFQSDLINELNKEKLKKKDDDEFSFLNKNHGGNLSHNLLVPEKNVIYDFDKEVRFLDNHKENERKSLIEPINKKIYDLVTNKSFIEKENEYKKYYEEFDENLEENFDENNKNIQENEELVNNFKLYNKEKEIEKSENKHDIYDEFDNNEINENKIILDFDIENMFIEESLDKRIRLLEKHIGVFPKVPELIEIEEEMENIIENLPDFLKEKINLDKIKDINNLDSENFNSELLNKDIKPESLFWNKIDTELPNEIKFHTVTSKKIKDRKNQKFSVWTIINDSEEDVNESENKEVEDEDDKKEELIDEKENEEQIKWDLDNSPNIMDNYYPLLNEKESEIIKHFDKFPNEETEKNKIYSTINEIMIYQNLDKDPYYQHYLNNIFKINDNSLYDLLAENNLQKDNFNEDNYLYNYETNYLEEAIIKKDENFEFENLFNKTVIGTGMRKKAKAVAFIKKGTGEVKINNRKFIEYFPELIQRSWILRGLYLTDLLCKIDIKVNVYGSGNISQSEACGKAVSKAISKLNPIFYEILDKNDMLKGDYRQREPKKTGLYRARKKYPYKRR